MMNTITCQQKINIDEAITRHAVSVFGRHPAVAAVYLLGSAVVGRLRTDSDIDVALLPKAGQMISLQTRLDLAAQLEAQLHRTIDVGVLAGNNLIYASEVLLNGKRIFTADPEYTESMEMRFLGCYLTFKQDRKVVEESYRAA